MDINLENFNVRKTTSYIAGAIGLPQFMPSSIKRYGKDGDDDKRIPDYH